MHLADFSELAQTCRQSPSRFEGFRTHASVSALEWPDDVLEQWLFDFADNGAFLDDYGGVDLLGIRWDVEIVPVDAFRDMPTGASDGDCIDEYATNPAHWIGARRDGVHIGVAQCWEVHGTWKRWPILIDRLLLDPPAHGLQVVEGRTRVGILRGRWRDGEFVALKHLAWVGRPNP